MSQEPLSNQAWNPWKFATIGLGVVFATALITGVVVAHYVGQKGDPGDQAVPGQQAAVEPQAAPEQPGGAAPAPAQPVAPPAAQHEPGQHAARRPSAADIDACNAYASSARQDKTKETITDALIGGALGAGLGAAGGAIAGGGGGAGKGAGIGSLVGVTAGTLYGLNGNNRADARSSAAYRACMKRRGYYD
jgi:hypothetical protein